MRWSRMVSPAPCCQVQKSDRSDLRSPNRLQFGACLVFEYSMFGIRNHPVYSACARGVMRRRLRTHPHRYCRLPPAIKASYPERLYARCVIPPNESFLASSALSLQVGRGWPLTQRREGTPASVQPCSPVAVFVCRYKQP
jgi:hypothetical protein